MSRPLDPFERWMVQQNLEYAKTEGMEVVVERLRQQGYDRVANSVEVECLLSPIIPERDSKADFPPENK